MFRRLVSGIASLVRRRHHSSTTNLPCEKCGKLAGVFVCHVDAKTIIKEQQFCEQCAGRNLWIPNPDSSVTVSDVPNGHREVPVGVEKVICYSGSWQQYVILREVRGLRRLTLVTGYFEASALWWFLKGEPHPRPPTHQAWLNTVSALAALVDSACVHDRQEDTYFTELRLNCGQERIKVDVRPSDALLLAMRARVPFLFTEKLLAAYGVSEAEPA